MAFDAQHNRPDGSELLLRAFAEIERQFDQGMNGKRPKLLPLSDEQVEAANAAYRDVGRVLRDGGF